jgi:hypothetical protein
MQVRILTDEEIKSPSVQEKETQAQKELEKKLDETGGEPGSGSAEPPKIGEQDVLSFIKDRYQKPINTLDELFESREQKEELPEDVAAFFRYKKETGRGFEDYVKLNRDFNNADPDELLREYALATEEFLEKDDVADFLAEKFGYDEDADEADSIKKKKSAKKREVAKAKKYFEGLKEQYKVPLESRDTLPTDTEEYRKYKDYLDRASSEQQETQRKSEWFKKKTEELFNPDFKGFDFSIGEKKLTFIPADASEVKNQNSSPMNFISKFLDEQGLIKDPAGYHRSLSIAMNPEKFAKFFYEQGAADATQDLAQKSKNINMDVRTFGQPVSTGGFKVVAANPSSSTSGGLRIKTLKT